MLGEFNMHSHKYSKNFHRYFSPCCSSDDPEIHRIDVVAFMVMFQF